MPNKEEWRVSRLASGFFPSSCFRRSEPLALPIPSLSPAGKGHGRSSHLPSACRFPATKLEGQIHSVGEGLRRSPRNTLLLCLSFRELRPRRGAELGIFVPARDVLTSAWLQASSAEAVLRPPGQVSRHPFCFACLAFPPWRWSFCSRVWNIFFLFSFLYFIRL